MQLGSVCSVCNLKMYIITQRAGENIKSRRFVLFPCKKSISCRVGIWSDARCFSVGSNHVPFVMHLLNYTSPHNVKLTQLLLHLYVMPSNRLNQIWTEILIFRYCWQLVTWKLQHLFSKIIMKHKNIVNYNATYETWYTSTIKQENMYSNTVRKTTTSLLHSLMMPWDSSRDKNVEYQISLQVIPWPKNLCNDNNLCTKLVRCSLMTYLIWCQANPLILQRNICS